MLLKWYLIQICLCVSICNKIVSLYFTCFLHSLLDFFAIDPLRQAHIQSLRKEIITKNGNMWLFYKIEVKISLLFHCLIIFIFIKIIWFSVFKNQILYKQFSLSNAWILLSRDTPFSFFINSLCALTFLNIVIMQLFFIYPSQALPIDFILWPRRI